jgi:transcriptional regulator with XRE-family HTH domain
MEQLSTRIIEFRQRKGYSQELLAELSGLNLRTIQRIEKGETVPRGDSLQRLSKALGTSPDDLIDWTIKEDKSILTMLNLSQLTFLVFPLLGILIPMAIWIFQKDKVTKVNRLGKSILNFQLSWAIVFFAFSGPVLYFRIPYIPADIFLIGTVFLYAYNLILIIINSILTAKNKRTFYEPSIKFLGK